jgi:hypothetical protein
MKEKPIIFSAPMVRAIVEGRKSQTRRIMKPQPDRIVRGLPAFDDLGDLEIYHPIKYAKGDRLWIRETWRPKQHSFPIGWPYEYKATAKQDGTPEDGAWKPSIHMPRAASRILLEITDVRVERLNDINEWDAIDEGLEMVDGPDGIKYYGNYGDSNADTALHPIESFRTLWESINGKGSWNQNPFVWVITFKKI